MHIDILSLFPEMFTGPFDHSIIKRAIEKGAVTIDIHQLRDWATDKHSLTDQRPFGGGPGMVLKPEPIFAAVEELKTKQKNRHPGQAKRSNDVDPGSPAELATTSINRHPELVSGSPSEPTYNTEDNPTEILNQVQDDNHTLVIFVTPQGHVFNQSRAQDLATNYDHLIILCGRYEGVDQRVRDHLINLELSLGDFVLSGGELPAMVISDAIIRLLPDVLGEAESLSTESHNGPLLDHPQYTQPATFRDWTVPDVLRSGNHAAIETWRTQQSEQLTQTRRPDLWEKYKKNLNTSD